MQKRLLLLLLLVIQLSAATAQKITANGTVRSAGGKPVSQATITIKGTTVSTSTNAAGAFSLLNLDAGTVLIISHVGFTTKEIIVRSGSPENVVLQENATDLDEVVVQGYGTTTRRLSTGSIGKVTATEIEKQPVSNPLSALQGRVPGVVITQTSGVPGSEIKVEIRGRSSLDLSLSRNDPLYVIDNVPFEPGNVNSNQLTSAANNPTSISQGGLSPLNSINPQDIESIEVLKDADATAIYGSRGANGVILITTKKGRPGKTRFSIRSSAGASRIARSMEMLNTQQYVQMRREAFRNDSLNPTVLNAPDLLAWDTTRYTDLRKLLIGKTALTSSLQATVSGGTANTQFSLSGSQFRQTNVYSSNLSDNVRSARFTLNHSTPDRKLTLFFSGIYANDRNELISTDLTRYINLAPNIKLYDSLGNLNWAEGGVNISSLNITNPLAVFKTKYRSVNENLSGNLNISYQLFPGLKLSASTGYNTFYTNEQSQRPKASINPASGTLASAGFAGSNSKSYIVEPQVEYAAKLGIGRLTVLAGATWQDRSSSSYAIAGSNYTSDLLLGAVSGAGQVSATNTAQQYRYTAVFGRVNYAFDKNTYILNLSGRRDASSRFGPDKRTANFGAAGAAWIFSNYAWVSKHLRFLSFGKLRGSYGITGNDQIGNYRYLDLWNPSLITYGGTSGLLPNSLFNGDYSWEINKKLEGALELGFLKDRVLLSVGYYRNRCSNQIVNYPLPAQTGFDNVTRNLPALVQNTGLEFLLSGKIIRHQNYEWTASFNATVPRNKLVSFPGLAGSSYASLFIEGQPLSVLQGLQYLQVDSKTGIYTFQDIDGDGQVTTKDRIIIGNLAPKMYGGFQTSFSYKNIQFSLFFEFRKQLGSGYLSQLSNSPPGMLLYNQPVLVLNRWQNPGDNKPIQRFSANTSSPASIAVIGNMANSSGIYTDASYIRCKNIAASYALPSSFLKKLHIESSRIYLQAQNLFVITGYQGADPETQNFYILPPLRTLVAGIEINL